VGSWYWGHGTLGPYYIVWFDAIDSSGNESVSGYVVKDEEVVGSSCDTLKVRPVDAPYPPTLTSVNPDMYTITMILNDGSMLNATVTMERTQIDVDTYARWIGTMTGTIYGEDYTGSALWEQFKFRLV